MKTRRLALLVVICSLSALFGILLFNNTYHKQVYSPIVVDVSWPNCTFHPKHLYDFGIVGVNGGLDFRTNHCLAAQLNWTRKYALYVNTGFPGDRYALKYRFSPKYCQISDSSCLAYNYGYAATMFAINYANLQNAHSNVWWLDVETENSWSTNPLLNRHDLEGAVAAIKKQYLFNSVVGVYSSPAQWAVITGNWHNKLPVWVATGSHQKLSAALSCLEASFSGGRVVYAQYTVQLDQNINCSSNHSSALLKSNNWPSF